MPVSPTGLDPNYPVLRPDLAPDYMDLQRKQMLAQALMQNAMQSSQTPQGWDSMRVVPRRSALSTLAPLAAALLGGKAWNQSQQAQGALNQKIFGIDQPSSPSAAAPNAPTPTSGFLPPNGIPGAQGPTRAPVPSGVMPNAPQPQPAQSNPMFLTGDPRTSEIFRRQMGPEAYFKELAGRYAPTEMEKSLRAAGIDPASPEGQQALRMSVAKGSYIPPVGGARPGTLAFDALTGRPLFAQPDVAHNVQLGVTPQGGVTASAIPGNAPAQAELDQATATGKTLGSVVQVPQRGGGTVPQLGASYFGGTPAATPPSAAPVTPAAPAGAGIPPSLQRKGKPASPQLALGSNDYWKGMPTYQPPSGPGAMSVETEATSKIIPQVRQEKYQAFSSQSKDASEQERNDIMALRNLGNATVGPESERVNSVKGVLNQFGLLSKEQADKLTSSIELGKYLNNNALANARQKFGGGRLTNTDVTLSIDKLNPGTNMTDKAIFNLTVENMVRSAYTKQMSNDFTAADKMQLPGNKKLDPQGFEQWYSSAHSLTDFANQHAADFAKQAQAEWKGGTAPLVNGPATRQALPAIGEIRKGYRYQGGEPHKPESWVKVQ